MFGKLRHFRSILDKTKADDSVTPAGYPGSFMLGHRPGAEATNSPYRSDGLVLLCFFRRGGHTGASGSSLRLALFLLASR